MFDAAFAVWIRQAKGYIVFDLYTSQTEVLHAKPIVVLICSCQSSLQPVLSCIMACLLSVFVAHTALVSGH